jgi:RNA polymerase sigma-70 factor (ECF subfamily)
VHFDKSNADFKKLGRIHALQTSLKRMNYNELTHSELVQACLKQNHDAWEEFFSLFNNVINLAILRTANRYQKCSRSFIEDLVQEIRMKLFANGGKLLRDFKPHCEDSIFGFLKRVATNLVHDHFRHVNAMKRGAQVTEDGDVYLQERAAKVDEAKLLERKLLIDKIEKILIEITGTEGGRDRQIFWLYYRQGFTAVAVAQLLGTGLTVKGVESVLHRLMKQLQGRLQDKKSDDKKDDDEDPEKGKSGSNSF